MADTLPLRGDGDGTTGLLLRTLGDPAGASVFLCGRSVAEDMAVLMVVASMRLEVVSMFALDSPGPSASLRVGGRAGWR